MKTLIIITTLLSVSAIATGIANIRQSEQIIELTQQVACLRLDMIYVGHGFCANKVIETNLTE